MAWLFWKREEKEKVFFECVYVKATLPEASQQVARLSGPSAHPGERESEARITSRVDMVIGAPVGDSPVFRGCPLGVQASPPPHSLHWSCGTRPRTGSYRCCLGWAWCRLSAAPRWSSGWTGRLMWWGWWPSPDDQTSLQKWQLGLMFAVKKMNDKTWKPPKRFRPTGCLCSSTDTWLEATDAHVNVWSLEQEVSKKDLSVEAASLYPITTYLIFQYGGGKSQRSWGNQN